MVETQLRKLRGTSDTFRGFKKKERKQYLWCLVYRCYPLITRRAVSALVGGAIEARNSSAFLNQNLSLTGGCFATEELLMYQVPASGTLNYASVGPESREKKEKKKTEK